MPAITLTDAHNLTQPVDVTIAWWAPLSQASGPMVLHNHKLSICVSRYIYSKEPVSQGLPVTNTAIAPAELADAFEKPNKMPEYLGDRSWWLLP